MDGAVKDLAESIRVWLDRPDIVEELNRYFAEPHQIEAGRPFSGRYFERLTGGGDRPEVCDRFTAADLVAAQMLSINVPPEMSLAILHGELGRRLNQLLRRIPTDVRLGDPPRTSTWTTESAAHAAWTLLEGALERAT